jgi:hypothetical protein
MLRLHSRERHLILLAPWIYYNYVSPWRGL